MFYHTIVVEFISFLIQFIKTKQNDRITKRVIKDRELYRSMLRFTRCFITADDSFQIDESSTEYSCIMTECKKKSY